MKLGMAQTNESLSIFLRIIGQAMLTDQLDRGKRYYAYEQLQDGKEAYQAFYDWQSRDAWVESKPFRYVVQRADLDQYQLREALWWTDYLIG